MWRSVACSGGIASPGLSNTRRKQSRLDYPSGTEVNLADGGPSHDCLSRRPVHCGEPEIRAAAAAAGYRLGFTYGLGLQPLGAIDPLDLRRLAAEHTISDARFCTLLAAPWIEA